ncbi:MAG: PEP-CTERM sorting domain-containing protein [Planctomycetota bacterium]
MTHFTTNRMLATTALVASLGLMAGPAEATIIVQESFDYNVGDTIAGKAGGFGFATSGTVGWTTPNEANIDSEILAGSLGPLNATTSVGGTLQFIDDAGSAGSGSRTNRYIDDTAFSATGVQNNGDVGGAATDGTIYISFLMNLAGPLGDSSTGFELALGSAGTGIAALGTDAAGSGLIGLIGKNGQGNILLDSADVLGLHHYVMKIDYNPNADDVLTLYIDPLAGDESSQTAAGTSTGEWRFDQVGFLNFQNAAGGFIDEIVIATEFSDVVTPEPGSLALLGLGGLLVARRRRG